MQYLQYKLFKDMNMYYFTQNDCKSEQLNFIYNKIINDFIRKYSIFFKTHLFILEYTDDVFGLISYNMLQMINQVYSFNFKIIFNKKIKNTKKYINKKDILKNKNKIKKDYISISTFNPLYYVADSIKSYNFLNSENSLIKSLAPEQLKDIATNFFNIKDEKLLNIFYEIPAYSFHRICNRESLSKQGIKKLYNQVGFLYENKVPKIKVYYLTGTEADFSLFDDIVKNTENLIFYNIPEEKYDFIYTNLYLYVPNYNIPILNYNVNIPEDILKQLEVERTNLLSLYGSEDLKRKGFVGR